MSGTTTPPLPILVEVRGVGPDPRASGTASLQWLGIRCGSGSVEPVKLNWDDGWREDLTHVAHGRESVAILHRLANRLLRLLSSTGWPREAARIRKAHADGQPVHLTVVSDVPDILRLPWADLPTGDGGAALCQLLSRPVTLAVPGAGTRPARLEDHPDGGRLLLAVPGDDDARIGALRATVAGMSARPAQELVSGFSLPELRDLLDAGVKRGRPVTLLHLVARVETRGSQTSVFLGPNAQTPVGVDDLATEIARHADRLRAVVLTQTGAPSADTSRLALALHRAGVPVVVAHRVPLADDTVLPVVMRIHDALIGQSLAIQTAVHTVSLGLRRDGFVLDGAGLQVFQAATASELVRPFAFAPYQGLAPYRSTDAGRFFGRAAETRKLADSLLNLASEGRPRFMVVAGAPRSGRTSLVEAGLFPELQARDPSTQLRTVDASIRPLAQLDEVLSWPRPDGAPLLLVVDPIDALVRSTEHLDTARRFVNRLWRLAASGTSRVFVVVVIQVDHLSQCGRIVIDDLGASLENLAYDDRHRLFVTEPGPRALREIIDQPAQLLGLHLDRDFTSQLMRAASRRPGSLQHTSLVLDLAWQQRHGESIPGPACSEEALLDGVFQRFGERLLEALPDNAHRDLLPDVLRTFREPDGIRPVLLHTVRPSAAETRSRFDRVIADLEGAGAIQRQRVGDETWLTLRAPELLETLPTTRADRTNVAPPRPEPRRSIVPRRPQGWGWVAALLVFAVTGAGLFGWWGQQSHQRTQALERFQSAERAALDPTTAAILLRQIPPLLRPEGWTTAANVALQSPQASRVLQFSGASVQQLTFSPDGGHLLIRTDGAVQVLETGISSTLRTIRPAGVDGGVVAAAFSPSGTRVLTVARSGRVQAWPLDGNTPEDILPAIPGDYSVVAAFSSRGQQVARAWGNDVEIAGIDGSDTQAARIPTPRDGPDDTPCCLVVTDTGDNWAIGTDTGRILLYARDDKKPKRLKHAGLRKFTLNRTGTHLLALGEGNLRIIDMIRGTGSNRTPTSVRVDAAAFSPDGRHIAVDYLDKETGERHARSVSVTARRDQRESPSLTGRATAMAATEGGERLLRAADGIVSEMDVETGVATLEYRGHRGPVREIRQSPDGAWLATSGLDGTVRLWRRTADAQPLVSPPPQALMAADPLVFAPQGNFVGGVTATGRFATAPLTPGGEVRDFGEAPSAVQVLRVSSDGSRIAAVDATEMLHVRDGTEEGSFSRPLPGAPVVISPVLDALIVRDGGRGLARLALDRADATPEPLRIQTASVSRAVYDPAARWLALGTEKGEVVLVDARTGQSVANLDPMDEKVTALCVSEDAQRAAVGLADGGLRLWSPQVGVTTLKSEGPVPRACEFSADTRHLVVQSGSEAEVWSLDGVAPQRLLTAPSRRPAGGRTARLDSRAGALVTLDQQGRGHTWLLDSDDLHQRLWQATPSCELAGEDPIDRKRWCACELCFGRTPAQCDADADDPLTADVDSIAGWCPTIPTPAG